MNPSRSKSVRAEAKTPLTTCDCGEPLPTHLADLAGEEYTHVCSCERAYGVASGLFVFLGVEENRFVKLNELMEDSECKHCGDKLDWIWFSISQQLSGKTPDTCVRCTQEECLRILQEDPSMSDFDNSPRSRKFFDHDIPELVRQLGRVADHLAPQTGVRPRGPKTLAEEEGERFFRDVDMKASEAIVGVMEVLWPEGDVDHEWDSSTASDIAAVLIQKGFRPPNLPPTCPPDEG